MVPGLLMVGIIKRQTEHICERCRAFEDDGSRGSTKIREREKHRVKKRNQTIARDS